MYAVINDGSIVEVRNPRAFEIKLLDGHVLRRPASGWEDRQLAACGLVPVTRVSPPAETDTHYAELSHDLVDGVPTQVWSLVQKSAERVAAETASRTAATNGTTLRSRIDGALSSNRTYLNLGSPTNAQVVAQVRSLTQQVQGLLRLVDNRLDGVD